MHGLDPSLSMLMKRCHDVMKYHSFVYFPVSGAPHEYIYQGVPTRAHFWTSLSISGCGWCPGDQRCYEEGVFSWKDGVFQGEENHISLKHGPHPNYFLFTKSAQSLIIGT